MKIDNKIELFLTKIEGKFRENQLFLTQILDSNMYYPLREIDRKSAIFDNKFIKNQ